MYDDINNNRVEDVDGDDEDYSEETLRKALRLLQEEAASRFMVSNDSHVLEVTHASRRGQELTVDAMVVTDLATSSSSVRRVVGTVNLESELVYFAPMEKMDEGIPIWTVAAQELDQHTGGVDVEQADLTYNARSLERLTLLYSRSLDLPEHHHHDLSPPRRSDRRSSF